MVRRGKVHMPVEYGYEIRPACNLGRKAAPDTEYADLAIKVTCGSRACQRYGNFGAFKRISNGRPLPPRKET